MYLHLHIFLTNLFKYLSPDVKSSRTRLSMTVTTFASVIGRTLFKSWLTNVGVEIMLDIPIKPLVFYFFHVGDPKEDNTTLRNSKLLAILRGFWTRFSRKRFRFQNKRIGLVWSRIESPKIRGLIPIPVITPHKVNGTCS